MNRYDPAVSGDDRIKVMIADDDTLFRRGLGELLREEANADVVGEAANGHEALEQARLHHPDVVVMDVRMPSMDGVEATREIKAELPAVNVVMLSAFDDEQQMFDAVQAGAVGYVLKSDEPANIVRAVRVAAAGNAYLEPTMTKRLLERLSRQTTKRAPRRASTSFTPRETAVLELLAQGRHNRDIAAELGISERTARNYVGKIFGKLHVQDRSAAIVEAVRRGLVRL